MATLSLDYVGEVEHWVVDSSQIGMPDMTSLPIQCLCPLLPTKLLRIKLLLFVLHLNDPCVVPPASGVAKGGPERARARPTFKHE